MLSRRVSVRGIMFLLSDKKKKKEKSWMKLETNLDVRPRKIMLGASRLKEWHIQVLSR